MSLGPEFMPYNCSSGPDNIASNTFTSNLNRLLDQTMQDTAGGSAYYNTSEGKYPDIVYGLYLCNLNSESCQECMHLAGDTIRKNCNGSKEAIIWDDKCMLRYSDKPFSSKLETAPNNCSRNGKNFTEPEKFRKSVVQSLDEVSLMATSGNASKNYAKLVVRVSGKDKLYSFAQCKPDLSIEDCKACLKVAANSLQSCYQDKQGARFLNPSCNIRFELYPFFSRREAPPSSPRGSPNGEFIINMST